MKVPERFKAGITRYTPADRDDLARFQAAMFGPDARQLDPERFAWMFERNPALPPGGPTVWISRRDGEIVGQQASIGVDLRVDGQVRRAEWTTDLMVDPAWRMKGVGPGLVATHLDRCDLALGITQSDAAIRSYRRSGWIDIGVVPLYVRPLDAAPLLRHHSVPARLRPLAPVAGAALRAADSAAAGAARVAGLRLDPVARFDDRVDDVWRRAAPDYGVLSVRDAAAIGYRLDERPDADRLDRYYLRRGRSTIGWVALRPHEQWGQPAATVVDYLAPARWVAPLLVLAGHAARRTGAEALTCRTLCAPAERALRVAGFVRRGVDVGVPLRLLAHCTAGDEVCGALGDPERWLITAGDSDLA